MATEITIIAAIVAVVASGFGVYFKRQARLHAQEAQKYRRASEVHSAIVTRIHRRDEP